MIRMLSDKLNGKFLTTMLEVEKNMHKDLDMFEVNLKNTVLETSVKLDKLDKLAKKKKEDF